MLNWNGKLVTLEGLTSLGHSEYPGLRILLVDNGSHDGSVEAIRTSFPQIEVLPLESNIGFARGNNIGIRHALSHGADQIMLLNNDTTIDPQAISRMSRILQSSSEIGIVVPKILYYAKPTRIWYAGGKLSFWTGTIRHLGIREEDSGAFENRFDTDFATGCCFLTRRSVFTTVGLLDETYYMYTEDADWSLRVRRAGFRIVFEPQAKIWHKISVDSGGHLSPYKLTNKFRSNFRFFARYAKWYHWLVFPWLNLFVNAFAAIRYITRPR
jgi:GT2 family glycosyltransferase